MAEEARLARANVGNDEHDAWTRRDDGMRGYSDALVVKLLILRCSARRFRWRMARVPHRTDVQRCCVRAVRLAIAEGRVSGNGLRVSGWEGWPHLVERFVDLGAR